MVVLGILIRQCSSSFSRKRKQKVIGKEKEEAENPGGWEGGLAQEDILVSTRGSTDSGREDVKQEEVVG